MLFKNVLGVLSCLLLLSDDICDDFICFGKVRVQNGERLLHLNTLSVLFCLLSDFFDDVIGGYASVLAALVMFCIKKRILIKHK